MLAAKKPLYKGLSILKPANYIFDSLMLILIGIYIIKENVLTVSLNINKEYFPVGEQRIELITGEKISRVPTFIKGPYTNNLDEYNLGPIPYNYPSAIGWFLHGKGPFEGISNYYITANILYFSALLTLLLSIIIIFKNFDKIYGYLFTFLILSSFTISEGSNYFYQIPNTINPGSVSIYAIAVSAIFLSSLKNNKLSYIFLLIFFSGVLLQNHLTSIIYASALLLYSMIVLFKLKKEKKNYLLLSFALIPWVQILFNIIDILTRYNLKIDDIAMNRNKIALFENNINQILPFNNIIDTYKINGSSLSYIIYLSIYIIPILNYFLIRKEINISNYKRKLFKWVSLISTIDIFINNYSVHEPQHRYYIAGQIFLFIIFLFVFLQKKINKKIIKITILILFLNLINFNMSSGANQNTNNKYLTKANIERLKQSPVILINYDYYNQNTSVTLELIYELIYHKIDFCVKKLNYGGKFEKSDIGDFYKSLIYYADYICTEKQLNEDRKKLYLIEDKAEALPIYFNKAVMLTRLPNNYISQKEIFKNDSKYLNSTIECEKESENYNYEYNLYDTSCLNKKYHSALVTNSLYLENNDLAKNFIKKIYDQKNILNNILYANEEIFYNVNNCKNCVNNLISLEKQDSIAIEVKEYLNYYHDYILSDKRDISTVNNQIESNLDILKNDFLNLNYDEKINIGKEEKLIGEYTLLYKDKIANENIILIQKVKENEYNIVANKNFTCSYKVYNIEKNISIDTPFCTLLNDSKYNNSINEKIKNKAIIKEIYQILYKNLNIENRDNILENITNSTYYNSDVIKSIEILDTKSTPTEKNNIFHRFTIFHDPEKIEYELKNKIISITAKVNYQKEVNSAKTNQCLVEIFQPWYYMIPKYHYIDIHSCN
jgi:hypothetical protein